VKGLEKSGDQAEGEGEHAADAIAAQVTNWLIKSLFLHCFQNALETGFKTFCR